MNKPMQVIRHEPFWRFAYPAGFKTGQCDLLVYAPDKLTGIACPQNIVIVTEPYAKNFAPLNSGTTVMDGIEMLATELYSAGYRWQHFIQHNPPAAAGNPESFSLVTFAEHPKMHGQFAFPAWKLINRDDLDRAINGLFPDWYGNMAGLPAWGKVITPL